MKEDPSGPQQTKRKSQQGTGESPNQQAARTEQEGDPTARASGANPIHVPDFPENPGRTRETESEKYTLASLLSTQTKLLAEMQTQNRALTQRLEGLSQQQQNTTIAMNQMVSELQEKQENFKKFMRQKQRTGTMR